VGRHAVAVVDDLERRGSEAHLYLLTDEAVRNAVEVLLYGDVVVDVDPGLAPLGVLVARGGKRLQGGPLHALEQGAAGAVELLKGAIVECIQETADLPVQFSETEEGVIAQRSQEPALG